MTEQEKAEIRSMLLELSEACPFHHSNPVECPLFELRTMSPADRLNWFESLSEPDLLYLARYHQICLASNIDWEHIRHPQ